MDMSGVVDTIQTWGPTTLRVGLLTMCAYHLWQRNIFKSIISLGACVATFILGW